jgi:hypothetical protein
MVMDAVYWRRLPHRFPSPPRHNFGTVKVGTAHVGHRWPEQCSYR